MSVLAENVCIEFILEHDVFKLFFVDCINFQWNRFHLIVENMGKYSRLIGSGLGYTGKPQKTVQEQKSFSVRVKSLR